MRGKGKWMADSWEVVATRDIWDHLVLRPVMQALKEGRNRWPPQRAALRTLGYIPYV